MPTLSPGQFGNRAISADYASDNQSMARKAAATVGSRANLARNDQRSMQVFHPNYRARNVSTSLGKRMGL